jgi:hypothetical protein
MIDPSATRTETASVIDSCFQSATHSTSLMARKFSLQPESTLALCLIGGEVIIDELIHCFLYLKKLLTTRCLLHFPPTRQVRLGQPLLLPPILLSIVASRL